MLGLRLDPDIFKVVSGEDTIECKACSYAGHPFKFKAKADSYKSHIGEKVRRKGAGAVPGAAHKAATFQR